MTSEVPICDVLCEAMEYLCKLGSNLQTRSERLKQKKINKTSLRNSHSVQKAANKVLLICELSKKSLKNVEIGINNVLQLVSTAQSTVGGKSRDINREKQFQIFKFGDTELRISKKVPLNLYLSARVVSSKMSLSMLVNYPVYNNCKLYRARLKNHNQISEQVEDNNIINDTVCKSDMVKDIYFGSDLESKEFPLQKTNDSTQTEKNIKITENTKTNDTNKLEFGCEEKNYNTSKTASDIIASEQEISLECINKIIVDLEPTEKNISVLERLDNIYDRESGKRKCELSEVSKEFLLCNTSNSNCSGTEPRTILKNKKTAILDSSEDEEYQKSINNTVNKKKWLNIGQSFDTNLKNTDSVLKTDDIENFDKDSESDKLLHLKHKSKQNFNLTHTEKKSLSNTKRKRSMSDNQSNVDSDQSDVSKCKKKRIESNSNECSHIYCSDKQISNDDSINRRSLLKCDLEKDVSDNNSENSSSSQSLKPQLCKIYSSNMTDKAIKTLSESVDQLECEEYWIQKRKDVKSFEPKEFHIYVIRLPELSTEFLIKNNLQKITNSGNIVVCITSNPSQLLINDKKKSFLESDYDNDTKILKPCRSINAKNKHHSDSEDKPLKKYIKIIKCSSSSDDDTDLQKIKIKNSKLMSNKTKIHDDFLSSEPEDEEIKATVKQIHKDLLKSSSDSEDGVDLFTRKNRKLDKSLINATKNDSTKKNNIFSSSDTEDENLNVAMKEIHYDLKCSSGSVHDNNLCTSKQTSEECLNKTIENKCINKMIDFTSHNSKNKQQKKSMKETHKDLNETLSSSEDEEIEIPKKYTRIKNKRSKKLNAASSFDSDSELFKVEIKEIHNKLLQSSSSSENDEK